jgi:hypothetical protein
MPCPHKPQDNKLEPFDPWTTLTARGGWGEAAEAKITWVAIGSIVNCPLWIAAMIKRRESQLRAEAISRRTVGSVSSSCNLATNGRANNEWMLGGWGYEARNARRWDMNDRNS